MEALGISSEAMGKQLELYKASKLYIDLRASATIGHGIQRLSSDEMDQMEQLYNSVLDTFSVVKFIPASGAASRMFKMLFKFINNYDPNEQSINSYINKNNATDLFLFFITIDKLPFHDSVVSEMKALFPNYQDLSLDEKRLLFIKTLLSEDRLDYANVPKGLLPFHHYGTHISTAFEEHLYEAATYAATKNESSLHFTISKPHFQQFKTELKRIQSKVETQTAVVFNVEFSFQKTATHTIAVKSDNTPFKINNRLLFRPSGHGALLSNLNQIDADIIFIKNIDNVVVKSHLDIVAKHKKVLAGFLIQIQRQVFSYLELLENQKVTQEQLIEIALFLSNQLNVYISQEFEKYAFNFQLEYLIQKLNRPIRVCGMVKNEGEPGGGPFWVKDENGELSLQIVEMNQINTDIPSQYTILSNATHFNPVDIVCSTKNYKGEVFDLHKFVDTKTYFVSTKSKNGKQFKTLECPGLWNGSMALWNTVFIEVPTYTFNPVKTVNDLLKSRHQFYDI